MKRARTQQHLGTGSLRSDNPSVSGDLSHQWVDPLADSAWDEMVAAFPGGTIFHSSAWARVLVETYGHRPHYLRIDRAGKPVSLVPLMEVRSRLTGSRAVCLPFSDECFPLHGVDMHCNEVLELLAARAHRQGWKYLELRGASDTSTPEPIGEAPFLVHRLRIGDDPTEVRARFSPAVQRALRKAERSGLKVRSATTWEAMHAFVTLHRLTRRRQGVPSQPLRFFQAIHREILEVGNGFVVLVEDRGIPIAAAVFLHLHRNAIFKFGASDTEAWRMRPNNLAMAFGIESLAERGIQMLSFGRTDVDQPGLSRFKRSFGASEHSLAYVRFRTASREWIPVQTRRRPGRLFRWLPLSVNRLAGHMLYPHLD